MNRSRPYWQFFFFYLLCFLHLTFTLGKQTVTKLLKFTFSKTVYCITLTECYRYRYWYGYLSSIGIGICMSIVKVWYRYQYPYQPGIGLGISPIPISVLVSLPVLMFEQYRYWYKSSLLSIFVGIFSLVSLSVSGEH